MGDKEVEETHLYLCEACSGYREQQIPMPTEGLHLFSHQTEPDLFQYLGEDGERQNAATWSINREEGIPQL
jgi:hypothetical protein